MRARILVAVLCALWLAPAAQADEQAWRRYMESGARALEQGRLMSAEDMFQSAVREAETLEPKGPKVVQSLRGLAEVYRRQGRNAQADALEQRARALAPTAGASEPGLDVADALDRYAALLKEQGKSYDARMVGTRAQALRGAGGGIDPALLGFNPLSDLRNYTLALRALSFDKEAEGVEALIAAETKRQSEQTRQPRTGDPSLFGWEYTIERGTHALRGARYADAQRDLEAAVAKAESFGPNDVRLANSLSFLAYAHALQRHDADAARTATRASTILERAAGSHHFLLVESYEILAFYQLSDSGTAVSAAPFFERSLRLLERDVAPEHAVVGLHSAGLAAAYVALGREPEAAPLLERALMIAAKAHQRESATLTPGLMKVVEHYLAKGRYEEADRVAGRVVSLQQKLYGSADHPQVVRVLAWYAGLLRRFNRHEDADAIINRVRRPGGST